MAELTSYKDLTGDEKALIVYPLFVSAITNISQVLQDKDGRVQVMDANGNEYDLGVMDLDIPAERANENETYVLSVLMPFCC